MDFFLSLFLFSKAICMSYTNNTREPTNQLLYCQEDLDRYIYTYPNTHIKMSRRLLPNIIVTGTPGCGKTSHSEQLESSYKGLKHIPVSDFAKKHNCIESFDEERDSSVVDEDKLLDTLEPIVEEGGAIIDWHCCEIFPERWIDLVIVLRCNNTVLYDRLEKRGYKQSKITENVEAEIMEVLLQEAKDNYDESIVIELNSEDIDSLDENVSRVSQWIENWVQDHPEGVSNETGA